MISVVIPMYNEADININLKEIFRGIKNIGEKFEILVVDDGSQLNCFERAIESAKEINSKKIKILRYTKNYGKGFALRHGFYKSKGEIVIFLDSGLELDSKQIHSFLQYLKNYDVIVGSKRHPQSKVHYPLFRRLMSRTYQLMNRSLFNLKIKDTQVGLKIFKRDVLEKIMPKILCKMFAFDVELLVNAKKLRYKIKEVPIRLKYRFSSTINPKAVFYMILDTLAIFYRLNILKYYDRELE